MEWIGLVYGATALVTTVLVFFASKRFSDRSRPLSVRFGLSVAAGIVWPLVIVGLIQFGSFVAYTKVADELEPEPLDADVAA